jgi:hypothetical protein
MPTTRSPTERSVTRLPAVDAESGAAQYREALALARLQEMRPVVAHCHLGLGKLYHRIGETERARENFTTATKMYRDMEMGFWLDQGEGEMAKFGYVEPCISSALKLSTSGGVRP